MKDKLMLSLLVVKGGVDIRNDRPELNNWGCRVDWEVWEFRDGILLME